MSLIRMDGGVDRSILPGIGQNKPLRLAFRANLPDGEFIAWLILICHKDQYRR